MSFVDWQPSTDIALNESATPARRIRWSVSGSASASVVSTASIVAMSGASMAAPLAMPPTRKPSPDTSVSLRTVSVVMIACAALLPPSGRSDATRRGMPDSMGSIGSGMPMRPVEHTRTLSARQPRCSAASSVIRSASRRPGSPVAALALPLFSTTAQA